MRILICSDESPQLVTLLAPLGATCLVCESLADTLAALTEGVDAVLLAEQALDGQFEALRTKLVQSSVPILLLGAASPGQLSPLAGRRRTLVVERPFTSRSLCSALLTLLDRTPAKSAELRSREEELALQQSQRMDAVESVIDGVAHDFNNMLTGIITSLELIQKRVADQRLDKVQFYSEAALHSAMSAAALTHRLLAFARQQPLDTRPVDINHHVRSLEELLVRTIGERISLKLELTNKPAIALVDPIQLESAVLNLVINARDALPQGGNIWVTTYAASSHGDPNLADGAYVALAVRDDGVGIEHSVISKVFDPFFTTKPLGQGTGLGLSMVYGFVRQSGGQVRVYSELEQGTTICLYLPRHYASAGEELAGIEMPEDIAQANPGQCVLVVDDEATVRMLAGEVLKEQGYAGLEAADGASGLKILQSDVRIDLLITDVGLPGGMNGRQLADAARVIRPELKVLFITGYAENSVIGNGHLEPGMRVLTKPFTLEALAARIDEMVDAPDGGFVKR